MSSRNDDLDLELSAAKTTDTHMSRLAVYSLFYGFLFAMFIYSSILFLKRRSRIMLFISAFAFISGTIQWATTAAYDLILLRGYYIHDLGTLDLGTRIENAARMGFVPYVLGSWFLYFMPIMSDAIVIWRAHAMYQHEDKWKWMLLLPSLCLVGSTVASLVFNGKLSNEDTWVAWMNSDTMFVPLQLSIYVLSLSTNVLTTAMIFFKLWRTRGFLHERAGGWHGGRGSSARILVVIVESGLVYSALQAGLVAIMCTPLRADSVNEYISGLFVGLYGPISAMYPLAVVILVQLQFSLADLPSLTASSTTKQQSPVHPPPSMVSTGQLSTIPPTIAEDTADKLSVEYSICKGGRGSDIETGRYIKP